MKKLLIMLLCGITIVSLTGCSLNGEPTTENETEEIEEKLDGLEGKWYIYNTATSSKTYDCYIEPDGKGYYKSVTSGHVFHSVENGDYYTIDGDKIIFYYADGSEWRSCTLSSNIMTCTARGVETYKR